MNALVTHVIVIRHGETDWNLQGRLQGHTDIALNATGRAQAQAVAQALHGEPLAAIYASNLQRALHTAQAIADAQGLPVRLRHDLRERGFGQWEGELSDDIAYLDAEGFARWRARDPQFAPPGGESLLGFHARVSAALDELAQRHVGERIMLVAHGGVLDAMYRHAAQVPLTQRRTWPLANASINRLHHVLGDSELQGGWWVAQWGEAGHLQAAAPAVLSSA